MNRKRFLKSIGAASAFLGIPFNSFSTTKTEEILDSLAITEQSADGSMVGFSVAPIKKVRVGIVGLGNRGQVLSQMFHWLIENNKVRIVNLKVQYDNSYYLPFSMRLNRRKRRVTISRSTAETPSLRN